MLGRLRAAALSEYKGCGADLRKKPSIQEKMTNNRQAYCNLFKKKQAKDYKAKVFLSLDPLLSLLFFSIIIINAYQLYKLVAFATIFTHEYSTHFGYVHFPSFFF